ncbi:hypothetical protein EDB92DRAFT_199557 [Lactarius akahatsu]|uniref:F-box domain-containing protein n=1 Tax=Lactarius akahatsu TaxID=416441 RepID=A0AAD4LNI4_9AGAM|nr:hypothetical protein EDB92DRAFT_199557 [Lactarius akahatsu]
MIQTTSNESISHAIRANTPAYSRGQGSSMSMILTRSTARTVLANRWSCMARADKLPENVLVEIFDAYRRDIELQPGYKYVWNSRDGWFTLAHVCRNWRRAVFSSPSRLHVHLLFTPRRSSKAPVLNSLPPFPILIDYYPETGTWTKEDESLALAAVSDRSRVREIALQRQCPEMAGLFKALSHPFPKLESLEIGPAYCDHETLLPAGFLSGSALSLRRLSLRILLLTRFSPLLSSATGLVELTLTLKIAYTVLPEAWFIASLQRMSHLRRLELNLNYYTGIRFYELPELPARTGDVVRLSELTHIFFSGHRLYFLALVDRLGAPLLQHLDVVFLRGGSRHSFPIPHLCKFICDAECQFTEVSLGFADQELRFCAGTSSQSLFDVQPFKIVIPGPVSLEQLGQELSGPLTTVEELSIAWDSDLRYKNGRIQWRGFFKHVPQVKKVRVLSRVAPDVAHSFQQGDQEPDLDLLPALEVVEVFSALGHRYKSICSAFEPLITARKRAGRPIRLLWTIWRQDSALVWGRVT